MQSSLVEWSSVHVASAVSLSSSEAVFPSTAILPEAERSQFESVSVENSLSQNSRVELTNSVQKELERMSIFSSNFQRLEIF